MQSIGFMLTAIGALLAAFARAWVLRSRSFNARSAVELGELQAARQRAELDNAFAEERLREVRERLLEQEDRLVSVTSERDVLRREYAALKSTDTSRRQRLDEFIEERDRLAEQAGDLHGQVARLESDLRSQKIEFDEQREGLNEKLELLQASEKKLSVQFENMANQIFEAKSESFRKTSADQLHNLLKPFHEQVDGLHRDVREASKERFTLGEQVRNSVTEAKALTSALKGDTKRQGDWGEVVLERILENFGLRKGEEYETQASFATEQGRLCPDVIVHLPEKRDIVIDSKVSLTAYERYVNDEDDAVRQAQLKAHVHSMRRHVEALAAKRYEDIQAIRSLDYILMWVPIELAYFAAMQAEPALVNLAMEKRVIPVCATTLFAVLKTIERVWCYERQNNNVQEVIARASLLYDKFRTYTEALDGIGTNIERAQGSYRQARKRLTDGPGNVVRQIEMLREMGVSPKKHSDATWVDDSLEGLDPPQADSRENS